MPPLTLSLIVASSGCSETGSTAGSGGTAGTGTGASSGVGGAGGDGASAGSGGGAGDGGGSGTAGTAGSGGDGGSSASGGSAGDGGSGGLGGNAGSGGNGGSGPCTRAKLLFFEDFETGAYERWTSNDYGQGWNGGLCHSTGFSDEQAVSGTSSHRSDITCVVPNGEASHRGYGGVQFDGDDVLEAYTNTGTGTDAPFGVVNTYYSWLEAPYAFADGKWFSFWTVQSSCSWSEDVVTLGLEDVSNRLTPAHIKNTGGTVVFADNAPVFPMGAWTRTTIYVNYQSGVMHIWQDGQELLHATFSRPTKTICQWHWGAYASGDNDDVVLYEDDISIYKLEEAWTDFSREPWLGGSVDVCD